MHEANSSWWKRLKGKLKRGSKNSPEKEQRTENIQTKGGLKNSSDHEQATLTHPPDSQEQRESQAEPWTEERLAAERQRQERQRKAHERRLLQLAKEEEAERQEEAKRKRKDETRRIRKTADMYRRAGLTDGSPRNTDNTDNTDHTYHTDHTDIYAVESGSTKSISAPKKISPQNAVLRCKDSENWSKYERDTGMVDPHILRWD